MATKRKHESLTLTTKMKILRKLDSGENQKDLAVEYNVGRATIYDINKNRKRIEHYVHIAELAANSRHTLKPGKFRHMEDALHEWFVEHTTSVLTGDKIKQKALEIHEKLYKNTEFKASDGWLHKFKARYGLNSQNIGLNFDDKINNKDYKTPYLDPEESDVNSEEGITTNDKTNNDSSQLFEVIWVEDDTLIPPKKLVKNEDALTAVDISIQWAKENNESNATLDMLKKLKDKIIKQISLHNKVPNLKLKG